MEDNRVFDTAARCLVVALAEHVRTGLTMAEVLTPLLDCVSGDWWDLVEMPEEVPEEETADFREAMKATVMRGHAVVTAAITATGLAAKADPAALAELLDARVFFHALGALHLNSIEVDIEDDPVLGVLEAVSAAPPQHRDSLVAELRPVLDGIVASRAADESDDEMDGAGAAVEDGESEPSSLLEQAIEMAPTLKGTGLFLQIRFCNHSCDPNAEVRFAESALGELVALEAIPAGAEVSISYFDAEDMSLDERAAELASYQVDSCGCRRCTSER
jgi:hypothetical protein